VKPGRATREQLERFGRNWEQGEHVFVSGPTGSGKTALARHIDQVRIDRGGHVIVFAAKLSPDPTLVKDYAGFTRWNEWKKNREALDQKVLLWPDVSKEKTIRGMRDKQRAVFQEAFDRLSKVGRVTAHIDEGLYMANPSYMGLSDEIAMLHAMGRSSKLTIITLTQRPAHLPLIVYSSASHAFVGRARELADQKRLAELGGKESSKELGARMGAQGKHDFLWVPVAPDWEAESVNLAR
jgi:ABC-type glutathione transport system ATPase component